MSSGMSSDEIIKREIIEELGHEVGRIKLRAFPQSSTDDQALFRNGGLTFGVDGVEYGSCDAAWYIDKQKYRDPYDNSIIDVTPVIALEGTDALTRGSSGNAQYQRFHHALGAVKGGLIGIYYLKPGKEALRLDLFRMAYCATKVEKGYYLIIQDLSILKKLLILIDKFGVSSEPVIKYMENYNEHTNKIWKQDFDSNYKGSWQIFADKRSTIIKDKYIIKYAGRMLRNFTDASQRAGHIAVGEMFLTKYFFENKHFMYLFLKMTRAEVSYLDKHKSNDKEWFLLRNEPGVTIVTIDELIGLPPKIKAALLEIKDNPLKGESLTIYIDCVKKIVTLLKNGQVNIDPKYLP